MKKLVIFFLVCLMLTPSVLWAACSWEGSTGTVASPYAPADVQACVDTASAKTGDVIISIPGAATWSGTGNAVTINMTSWAADKVVISGAGTSSTIITVNKSSGLGFAITTKDGMGFEFKDITVSWADTSSVYFMLITGTGGRTSPATKGINIHGNTFTRSSGLSTPTVFYISPRIYGVIHNNTFTNTRAYMTHSSGGLSDMDAEWTAAAGLGGDKFLFIENNTISLSIDATDGYASAKTVTRYNNYVNTYWMTHEGGPNSIRGYRAFEVYNNLFSYDSNKPASVNRPFFVLSGAGVIYNNTLSGTLTGVSQYIDVDYALACSRCCIAASYYRTFRAIDGVNTKWVSEGWDTPPACDTYPCQDQLGSGQDTGWGTAQTVEGVYAWGNTTPTGNLTIRLNPGGCAAASTIIKSNRDYFNVASVAAAKSAGLAADYAAYTCPHPLAGAGTCDADTAGISGYTLGGEAPTKDIVIVLSGAGASITTGTVTANTGGAVNIPVTRHNGWNGAWSTSDGTNCVVSACTVPNQGESATCSVTVNADCTVTYTATPIYLLN